MVSLLKFFMMVQYNSCRLVVLSIWFSFVFAISLIFDLDWLTNRHSWMVNERWNAGLLRTDRLCCIRPHNSLVVDHWNYGSDFVDDWEYDLPWCWGLSRTSRRNVWCVRSFDWFCLFVSCLSVFAVVPPVYVCRINTYPCAVDAHLWLYAMCECACVYMRTFVCMCVCVRACMFLWAYRCHRVDASR